MISTIPFSTSDERLAALYNISQMFNASLDFTEVLEKVMDQVIATTNAERGFILYQEGKELSFQVARGMDRTSIDEPEFEISRSVVNAVVDSRKTLLTSNAQAHPSLFAAHSVVGLQLLSILCAPIIHKGDVLGVIYVENRIAEGIFTERDKEMLASIASSAAIALENARLYGEAVEKGRMEQELITARKVQTSLIPQKPPEIPGWQIAAHWEPAREVAGDYYDFIYHPNDEIDLLIADVVDKGMPAALFMTFSRAVLRATITNTETLAQAVHEANRLMFADAAYGMFITLVAAKILPNAGVVQYVNAGHNPPLLLRNGVSTIEQLMPTGVLVGVEDGMEYRQELIQLEPEDVIFFYTDGIPDAANDKMEEYGMDRLQTVLTTNKYKNVEQIKEAVLGDLGTHVGDAPPVDDITLVVIKRT